MNGGEGGGLYIHYHTGVAAVTCPTVLALENHDRSAVSKILSRWVLKSGSNEVLRKKADEHLHK